MTGLAAAWWPVSTAVSAESQAVGNALAPVRRARERSQSLFGGKSEAISQIWALVNECTEPGWDGEDAEPIDQRAAFAATSLIRVLPEDLPLPEATVDPDGAVSLDWACSRHRVFSVSVGSSRRLAFAWLDGTDRGHGVAEFDGERAPKRILDGVREILRHASPSVRTR